MYICDNELNQTKPNQNTWCSIYMYILSINQILPKETNFKFEFSCS